MTKNGLDYYASASKWTVDKVAGAADHLDASTPCDDWDVRELLNHMLETQRYFLAGARGEEASPPSPTPPEIITDDPASDFATAREEMLGAFGGADVPERAQMMLGIAFSDLLLHGWDVARATDQDATMPDGLADAAYESIHGKFTDEQRKGVFAPEIAVGPDVSAQERLLAYTGRSPR